MSSRSGLPRQKLPVTVGSLGRTAGPSSGRRQVPVLEAATQQPANRIFPSKQLATRKHQRSGVRDLPAERWAELGGAAGIRLKRQARG